MITRTVYSLYYPEVRDTVDELWGGRHHEWYERNYTKHQDAMHHSYLDTWREWSGVTLGDAFPNAYPTNGASEPIKDLIIRPGNLHVFDGEYEGYGMTAKDRGMKVTTHTRDVESARERYGKRDQFWISQPSAIDGNVWPHLDAWLDEMQAYQPHVRIFLDVTYVGATAKKLAIEPARHPNVAAVVFSLSKPMGVYYHRIGGCFSRQPIGTLWGNLWFKNLFSIKFGTALMQRFGVTELPTRYGYAQQHVIDALKRDGKVPRDTRASDVVLLAHSADGSDDYRRATGAYRYCLTQGMDTLIKGDWQ